MYTLIVKLNLVNICLIGFCLICVGYNVCSVELRNYMYEKPISMANFKCYRTMGNVQNDTKDKLIDISKKLKNSIFTVL